MKNKLGFLGFLGLLGIVGFFTPNKVYFFFFAFLYFFRYFSVIPDELFNENVKKAATPAFFTGLVIYTITAALTAFSISTLFFVAGLVLGFAASFLVFTILFVSYELKESSGK
jgi:hypothetical protein